MEDIVTIVSANLMRYDEYMTQNQALRISLANVLKFCHTSIIILQRSELHVALRILTLNITDIAFASVAECDK